MLDPPQPVLPVARQPGRGERVPVEQADDVQALLGADERARVALDVADVDQALDDRRARRGGADAGVLHRLAQLVVVDQLAGRLHRGEQGGVRVAARRLGLLLRRRDLERPHGLALIELGQRLVGRVVVVGAGGALLEPLAVDAAPARHDEHPAAGAEDVLRDGGLQPGVLEHGVGVEDGEEAPRDHVVDPAVVVGHLVELVLGLGRDDRVVVGDLGVVDHAAQRQRVEPGHVGRGGGVLAPLADQRGGRLDLVGHVAGQETRVRARIGERLVLLVEPLSGAQRAARGEPVAVVGFALQRGEVVQERRALLLGRRLELGDRALASAHGGDDRLGLGGRLQARPGAGVEAALVAPAGVAARRLEGRVHQPVRLGHERADLLLAARDQRQRRRLHTAEGDGAVERGAQPDGRRARGVHADDPVGLRARAGRLLEPRELVARAQVAERGADRRGRHRGEPQAVDRLGRVRLLDTSRRRSARPRGRRRRR